MFFLYTLACSHASPIVINPGGPGGDTNAGASPGSAYGWEGTAGDVNTGTGNKVTSVPLVAWTARGGLPVSFALTHNSQATYSNFNGQKWTYSYLDFLVDSGSTVTAYWDDGSYYNFTLSGSVYTAPAGIHNTLVKNGTGNFTLTTRDQIAYRFTHVVSSEPGYAFLTNITDENGNAVGVTYTSPSSYQVYKITDPTGRVITLGYDSYSRLSTVTDPLGRVWTLGYIANPGNFPSTLLSVTFPAVNGASPEMQFTYGNHVINSGGTFIHYDAYDIVSIKDLNGNTGAYGYNTDSTIASEQDPQGNTTGFSYTSTATTITDPNGHTRVDTYDTSGRRTSVQDAEGYSDIYAYDSDNNVLTHQDRNGKTWTYTYDTGNADPSAHGNLLSTLDPRNKAASLPATVYTYTAHNRLSTVVKPSSTKVTLNYDGLDNLTSVVEGYGSPSTTVATTTIAYPSPNYGLPASKKDNNGHVTTYAFGTNGYLYKVSTPLGKTTTWYYDTLGFPTQRIDAMNRTTTYAPDAWERLATITYPDSSRHTFGYDNNGNLTAFADAAVSVTRSYDDDNRMTGESYGGSMELTNTYDASGQRGLRSSSGHGTQDVTYTYTPRDELYTVADAAGTSTYGYTGGGTSYYGYDADGNQTQQTLANGARVGKLFDADSSLTEVNNLLPSGTTASRFLYTAYDADGRKSARSDLTGSTMAWGYDHQSHLATDTRTGGYSPYHDSFTLDTVGNRSQQTNIYAMDNFLYNADDQLYNYGAGGYTFAYNDNGDMSSGTLNGYVTNLTYDYDDNLTGISSASGTVAYLYDALGRRVYREDASGVGHTFVYDGPHIVAEYNDTSQVWDTQYTYGYDMLDKQGTGGTEFPLYDGMGDVYQSLTPSGSYVLSAHILDDFGQGFTAASGTEDLAYQWRASSGYRTDGDGLWNGSINEPIVQVGARYYIPSMGVFITRDTDLGQRPYEYCNADPVNNVDPSGHDLASLIAETFGDITPGILQQIANQAGGTDQGVSTQLPPIQTNPGNLAPLVPPLPTITLGSDSVTDGPVTTTIAIGLNTSGYVQVTQYTFSFGPGIAVTVGSQVTIVSSGVGPYGGGIASGVSLTYKW